MSFANDPSRRPDVTINSAARGAAGRHWWDQAQPRVLASLDLLRTAVARAGGGRRVAFTLSMAMLAGGLGGCLARASPTSGPEWMAVGGGLLGFTLPLPRRSP